MNLQNYFDIEAALAGVEATCACYNIRKAARLITQFYDEALAPSGLRSTQFNLLAILAHAGAVNVSRLAQALGMDRTTLTRNLRPLENQQFIEIDAGFDRRTHVVRLTEKGSQTVNATLPLWQDAQARLIRRFGQARLTGLFTELNALETQLQGA